VEINIGNVLIKEGDMQKIGIAGCGKISGIYLTNLTGMFGKRVKVTSVADLVSERVEKAAADYGVTAYNSAAEMVKSPDVDIVLNLTQPQDHYNVAMAALNAGKHVYNEKALCAKREEAEAMLKLAA
jgi:predicted dehydrogenase